MAPITGSGSRGPEIVFICVVVPIVKFYTWGPFCKHGIILIPEWISNYIHYKVGDEIPYPFPNFHGATVVK